MNPVLAAAAEIDDLCVALGLPYCFIGGLAVLRWGEPPTARNARTGQFTPPGITALGRSNKRVDS